MNIALWLERIATLHPDRPALYSGLELIADYGTFHDRALRLAGAVRTLGIKPGERVALFMSNCPDYLIALYGIWYAGAVAVPVNAKLHGREAAYILGNAGVTLVFATPDLANALEEHAADVPLCVIGDAGYAAMLEQPKLQQVEPRKPDDLAWLFYTSGTTGKPKGVMITHRMLVAMSLSYQADVDTVEPGDVALYAAPLSHGAGIYNMMHVRAGASHVCPASGGFDPAEIFDLAQHYESVHMFAAPTMVTRYDECCKSSGADRRGSAHNRLCGRADVHR